MGKTATATQRHCPVFIVSLFNVQAKGAERNKRFVSRAKCPNNRKCFLKNSEMQTVLELIYLKYLSLCHAD